MIPQGLAAPARLWLLGAATLVVLVAVMVVPAMPQPLSYHAFVDGRTMWAVPNALNVLSNLPFLVGGVLGLALLWSGGGAFLDPREKLPYAVFFLGALLTSFGSSWYHLAPDNARLVWDRLPMTLGFAGLVAAAVAERADRLVGLRSVWPLLVVGAATVIYWDATERMGAGNVIPYAAYQAWTILIVLLLLVAFPARHYSHGSLLIWAAAWYALAKVFEAGDGTVHDLTGGLVSGHTIKHLFAAGAVFAILRQLRLRQPLPVSTLARTA